MSATAAHADSAGIDHYCWPQHGIERVAADARPTLHYRDTQTEIHRVVVGPFDNNVFIVRCRASGDAVLIDAANEHEPVVMPGHGDDTTIGRESPHLQEWIDRGW